MIVFGKIRATNCREQVLIAFSQQDINALLTKFRAVGGNSRDSEIINKQLLDITEGPRIIKDYDGNDVKIDEHPIKWDKLNEYILQSVKKE
jgi:hypothetical protein